MNSLFGGVPPTIINHHQPSSTIINHHQPSSTIISHHQPSSTIINQWFLKIYCNLGWHDLQLETVDRPRKKCSVHYIRCFNPNQAKAKGWLSEWKWWHFHPCIHVYIYLSIYLFICTPPKSNMELHAIPEVYIYIYLYIYSVCWRFIHCMYTYSIIQYDDSIICIYLCIHAGYMSVDIQ